MSEVLMRTRRQRWLRIWVLPMSFVAVIAIAALVAEFVLIPVSVGRWIDMGVVAFMGVFTIGANMWMAWESVR